MTDRIFSHSGWCFDLLPPLWTQKIKIKKKKKMKETPEDIIILEMCTTNDSYMMYGA